MTGIPQITINTDMSGGLCFGCGQNNPIGLKLSFRRDDSKTVRTEFTPGDDYQGWPGMLHGGIIGCVLDEAMSYATQFSGFTCITARMEIRLRRPAPLKETYLVTGTVTRHTRKLINTTARMMLPDGTVVADSKGTHFVVEQDESNPAVPEIIRDG